MIRSRAFRRILAFGLGDVFVTASNVVVSAIVLHHYSKEEFGYLTIGQAINVWLQPLIAMGAATVGVGLIASHPREGAAIARRFLQFRLASAAMAALVLVAGAWFADPRMAAILRAYAVSLVVYAAQPDFLAIALERAASVTRARALASVVFLGGVLAAVGAGLGIWAVPMAYACGLGLATALLYAGLAHSGLSGFRAAAELPRLRQIAPVVGAQFCQMGTTSVDTLMIGAIAGHAVAGEYGAASRMVQVGAVPMVAVINSFAPSVSSAYSRRDRPEFWRLFRQLRAGLLVAAVVAAAGLSIFGAWALETVSGRPMPTVRMVLPVFALALVLIGIHSPYSLLLNYLGSYSVSFRVNAAMFLVVAAADAFLIRRWSAFGGPVGLVIGVTLMAPMSYLGMRVLFRAVAMPALGGPTPGVLRGAEQSIQSVSSS